MRHRLRTVLTVSTVTAVLLATLGVPGHAGPVSVSTGGGAVPEQAPSRPAAATFDGIEIFTGLFLGQGPVAERFPELVVGGITAEDATPAEVAAAVTQITDAVAETDRRFFTDFQAAVTSGDRVRVDRALRSAEELLATVLTEQFGAARVTDDQSGTCFIILIIVALVAAINVAAGVNAVVAANINVSVNTNITWDPFKPAPPDGQRLDFEQWVDEVAETLAV